VLGEPQILGQVTDAISGLDTLQPDTKA